MLLYEKLGLWAVKHMSTAVPVPMMYVGRWTKKPDRKPFLVLENKWLIENGMKMNYKKL